MNLIQSPGAARAICMALLLLPAMAHGQHLSGVPTDTLLSLDDLPEEVQANNPSLRASRLEAEAPATRSRQVSAFLDPAPPRPLSTCPPLALQGIYPGAFDGPENDGKSPLCCYDRCVRRLRNSAPSTFTCVKVVIA